MISLLVIGNEILSAQVEEANLKYALPLLAKAGYSIDEIRVVGDDIERIAEAINDLSARSQFVISCGGIGPTHDDLTFKAYAHAFGVGLSCHPELERRLREYYGDPLPAATLAHAVVPENVELLESGAYHWPVLKVSNCFVLPGLPEIFVKKFDAVLKLLPATTVWFYGYLLTSADEAVFAADLSSLQDRYPQVELGSYPVYNRIEYAARVTLKSKNAAEADRAFRDLTAFFESTATLVGSQAPAPYDPGTQRA